MPISWVNTTKKVLKVMMLEEANARLKNKITTDQLWGLNSLYLLLDLDKDDFCKVIDILGIEKLLSKQNHYDRIDKAEKEFSAKEKYLKAKHRLWELSGEQQDLESIVSNYEKLGSVKNGF